MAEVKKSDISIYTIIISLAIIGIGLGLYLFYEYIAPPHISLCYINAYINCEASTKGSLANTLGIPTALWGITGYAVILVSAARRLKKLMLGTVIFGLLFCLRITFLELFAVKSICPVCLACQTDMLILFILAIIAYRKPQEKISVK